MIQKKGNVTQKKQLHTHVHERNFCFKRMPKFMNFALSLGTTHARESLSFEKELFRSDNLAKLVSYL